ncbi:uncharacterized protein [Branchiostoma lanceolatum]|uniref:uncharacterized protein n=1 Tax=Branchiostoma lanceolatum TaxID=7740 RepID=UPI0034524777
MPRRKSKKPMKRLNEWKAKQQIKDRVDKHELHIRGQKPAVEQVLEVRGEDLANEQELEVRGEDLANEQVLEVRDDKGQLKDYARGTQQMGPPVEKQNLVRDKPHLEEVDKSGPSHPHEITPPERRSRSWSKSS